MPLKPPEGRAKAAIIVAVCVTVVVAVGLPLAVDGLPNMTYDQVMPYGWLWSGEAIVALFLKALSGALITLTLFSHAKRTSTRWLIAIAVVVGAFALRELSTFFRTTPAPPHWPAVLPRIIDSLANILSMMWPQVVGLIIITALSRTRRHAETPA
ncbi:MAG: hypothetical protein LBV06_08435 [Propionibacteriaceae bacterium]|jgi:hypothetical protein|nr:hypothetical protein [Propionibacteriaceae bacterium]